MKLEYILDPTKGDITVDNFLYNLNPLHPMNLVCQYRLGYIGKSSALLGQGTEGMLPARVRHKDNKQTNGCRWRQYKKNLINFNDF